MKQMRIMICDDEKEARDELRRCVNAVWPEAGVEEADSARTVLQKIRRGEMYDLLFLDIYLDTVGGIEAGSWIRDNFPEISMVFVSNSREFGPELFAMNALHYLMKPCTVSSMKEVRRRYVERQTKNAAVRIRGGFQEREIPFQRIAYIESEHNNLRIHLINGSLLTVRDSLQNYMEKLDERFLRINRGVVVNMEVVDSMNADSCEIGGKIFLLSRKSRRESRRRYNDYLFEMAISTR